ncbi:hypothetical protein EVJ58_g2493 [Rhodofomes roseus]|uniref:Uncharacterized protein n=1 Tax=Rhodofomes roseus TaxID=34475 RepID=A0A4Y9YSG0_9APHY|nr:hypothetical protein EVJ58_g2493 [Rhodofomes roseus]
MATLAHIMINTETFFAETFLSKKKTKVAQHTQTQVADMCVAALELGLNTGKNSWAVQSPLREENLHHGVQRSVLQCYPAYTHEAPVAMGQICHWKEGAVTR